MSKKVLTIRLPESKHQQLIGKIGDNSINGIFERLTDLIINETIIINPQGISFRQQSDSNMIADNQSYQGDSNLTALTEVEGIKKQIDCIMTALELKGNHSNRLDTLEDKVKQLDSNLTALTNRQQDDCKIITDKNKQQDDSIMTALAESQLKLSFDEDVEIIETPESIDIGESGGFNEDNNEQLPSNIELESIENDEGIIITPEKENDSPKSDSEGAKNENLPQTFLELQKGKLTATAIAKSLSVTNGTLTNWGKAKLGKGTTHSTIDNFWDYLTVSTNDKGKLVWEKIK